MTAFPPATAVTRPFLSTVATSSLLLFHVTDLSVASAGAMLQRNCIVSPASRTATSGAMLTEVTGITTETAQVAVNFPSAVVQVTLALPTPTPVSVPSEETLTMSVFSERQVTALLVAYSGVMVALILSVLPRSTVTSFGTSSPVTSAVTVTVQSSYLSVPSSASALIVTMPG